MLPFLDISGKEVDRPRNLQSSWHSSCGRIVASKTWENRRTHVNHPETEESPRRHRNPVRLERSRLMGMKFVTCLHRVSNCTLRTRNLLCFILKRLTAKYLRPKMKRTVLRIDRHGMCGARLACEGLWRGKKLEQRRSEEWSPGVEPESGVACQRSGVNEPTERRKHFCWRAIPLV